jgi:secreted trypsin-like serine protease
VTTVTDGTTGVVGLAPEADTSACVHDSGAPYFTTTDQGEQLISIESGGPTCPHDQEETTARVDALTGWLQSITERPSPRTSSPTGQGTTPGPEPSSSVGAASRTARTRRRSAAKPESCCSAVVYTTSRSIDQYPWMIRFRSRAG